MAKMKPFRLIGVALLAVFALSAAIASTAQAETAPSFTVGGTRLIAGKTHNIDVKATKEFALTNASGLEIKCTGLSTEQGVLLGSNPGNPGRDNEILVFSGCKLEKGNGAPECHLAASAGGAATTTIKTNAIVSEQVENVVSGTKGNQLLEEFLPAPSAGGVFVTLFFGPAVPPCTVLEAPVAGSVAGEARLDNAGEGKIELGQAPQERTSWLTNFPAAPITQVWLISSGVGKIQKVGQEAFTLESTQTGQALILLANTKFEPERSGLWSPLP
jgi:hypothetical protein